MFNEISVFNYWMIVEGMIVKMEGEFCEKESEVKRLKWLVGDFEWRVLEVLKDLENMILIIVFFVSKNYGFIYSDVLYSF